MRHLTLMIPKGIEIKQRSVNTRFDTLDLEIPDTTTEREALMVADVLNRLVETVLDEAKQLPK